MAVQAGNKMQMLGMILVTGKEPNTRELIHCLKGHSVAGEMGGILVRADDNT